MSLEPTTTANVGDLSTGGDEDGTTESGDDGKDGGLSDDVKLILYTVPPIFAMLSFLVPLCYCCWLAGVCAADDDRRGDEEDTVIIYEERPQPSLGFYQA